MSTAIVPISSAPQLAGWESKVDLIKRTIAVGASQDELEIFFHQCRKTGLDPLAKQIYFQKRGGKMTIITGIDGYRLVADRTGQYAGNDDPVFDDDLKPTKATVTVYKIVGGARCGFTASARWSQYFPGDTLGFMWKKMPHLMLGKCAEALALRKAFPAELSGVYTAEEMHQAGESSEPEYLPAAEAEQPIVEGIIEDISENDKGVWYKIGSEICTTNNPKLSAKLAGAHSLKVKLAVHSQKLNGKVNVIVNVLDVEEPKDMVPALAGSVTAVTAKTIDVCALEDETDAKLLAHLDDEQGRAAGIIAQIFPEKQGKPWMLVISAIGLGETKHTFSTFHKSIPKQFEGRLGQRCVVRYDVTKKNGLTYRNINEVIELDGKMIAEPEDIPF